MRATARTHHFLELYLAVGAHSLRWIGVRALRPIRSVEISSAQPVRVAFAAIKFSNPVREIAIQCRATMRG